MKNGRLLNGENIIVEVRNLRIGEEGKPIFIAGPCSVESREQIISTAMALKDKGVHILRGGVFKPRTSPYDFQGLGEEGLKYLKEASELTGLPIITEVMDEQNLGMILESADIIQIGSRNMHNYSLLKAVGKIDKPVLLKRGMSATIKEWVMAAEYIAASGNKNIILCERGIRTFDTYTRNTLDLAAVPIMKSETGLPVIVDPSHATGKRELIGPMSKAAIACGADGLMIEVHIDPDSALCDGPQSLTPDQYGEVIKNL
jgi:3-deoxy-7-phosphoheptulonate synthase